jgi:DNA-binding transcriptional LysR family regulator
MEWLVPRLAALRASDPALQLELKPARIAPDLSRHDVDLYIQYASNYEPELVLPPDVAAVEFVQSPIVPVASPEYLASSAPLRRPEDLLDHQLIDDEGEGSWTPWFACFGIESDRTKHAGPRFWYPHLALDAARRSHGVLLSTRFIAQADLDAGHLVEVVGQDGPFRSGQTGSYWLLGRKADWNGGPWARFREWIVSATAEHREPVDPAQGREGSLKTRPKAIQPPGIERVRGGA